MGIRDLYLAITQGWPSDVAADLSAITLPLVKPPPNSQTKTAAPRVPLRLFRTLLGTNTSKKRQSSDSRGSLGGTKLDEFAPGFTYVMAGNG